MSRTVRLSLALLFALMMVIATASAALAFDPPAHGAADRSAAAAMTGVAAFPAVANEGTPHVPGPGGFPNAGPWHATGCGPFPNPSGGVADGPIDFDDTGTCP